MPRAHILVVDDDPDMQDVMALSLEMGGYEVSRASNGQQALERAAEEMPALVLLDMRMPIMNGWEFAREFRARHGRACPIVVVTAAENAQLRAREIEAEGWLAKPFDLDDVLRMVARFVPVPDGAHA